VSRRSYLKYVAGGAVAVAVAAAGGYYALQPKPAEGPPTTVAPTTVAPTTVAIPTTELQMAIWGYHPEVVEENMGIFEQQYSENGTVQVVPGDYGSVMETKFMGKAPIDVCYALNPHAFKWYTLGWLSDVEGIAKSNIVPYDISEIKDAITPGLRETIVTPEGKMIALPYFASVDGTLFANDQLLEDAGFAGEYPKTYSELYDQLEKITKKGFPTPYLPGWMAEWHGISFAWIWEAMNIEGDEAMFDSKTLDPTFDTNTAAAEILKNWKRLYDNNVVPKAMLTSSESDNMTWFKSGKYAYHQIEDYNIGQYNDPSQSTIGGKVSIVQNSTQQKWGDFTAGWYAIVKRDRTPVEQERVNRLMEFFSYKDKNGEFLVPKKFVANFSILSMYPEVLNDPTVKDQLAKAFRTDPSVAISNLMSSQIVNAQKAVWFMDWNATVLTELPLALTGKKSINDVITTLREEAISVKKKYQ